MPDKTESDQEHEPEQLEAEQEESEQPAEPELPETPEPEPAAGEAEEADTAEQPEAAPPVKVAIVADGQSHFTIVVPAEPSDVESFAAAELANYIQKISGVAPEVREGGEGVERAILIGGVSEQEMAEQGIRDDGFVIAISPEAIRLLGGKQRGTLFAVYTLLERIGCRWPIPGEEHEYTPHRGAIEVDSGRTLQNPRFVVRGFVQDTNYVDHGDEAQKEQRIVDDTEFIDWLAKNRCSHFHFRAPEEVLELLHYELQQRGLGYETGGHIIPGLLPRELFEEHPGYFRMSTKGNREPSGNLCVSNPEALRMVRDNFLKYIESIPKPDLVHFWGDDVRDGGWCCCPQCRELLPQDQYLTACNYVAEALEGTGVTIDYIAYHDTLEADLSIKPRPEVLFLFAPRERSYGSSIGDPKCEANQLYADALRNYVAVFDGNAQVFEYYADAILFGSLAVPLHHVIAEDLAFYESIGVKRIEELMFGRFSWWAYPLNMYAFARLAWDAEADVDDIVRDYCQAVYGDAADAMRRVLNLVEEGMRQVATYGDIKHPWRSEESRRTMHKRVLAGIDLLASAGEPMARAKQLAEDTRAEPLVQNQYQLWLYTLGEVDGTATQVDGLVELESAENAEGALKAKYLRVASLKLRDAAGIAQGGLDIIGEVEDEVKGPWGMTGLVRYHERLISHLEKLAQDTRQAIPPEPEPEPEPEPKAEAAEPAAEAQAEPEVVESEAQEAPEAVQE